MNSGALAGHSGLPPEFFHPTPGNGQFSPYRHPTNSRGAVSARNFPVLSQCRRFGTPLVEPAPGVMDDSLRVALTSNFAEVFINQLTKLNFTVY
jgi:hypothetical protein